MRATRRVGIAKRMEMTYLLCAAKHVLSSDMMSDYIGAARNKMQKGI